MRAAHLGMQFGEDPSISHVANRFMGTGLLRAPLPGKLNRPLLSAMVLAAGWDCPTPSRGFVNSRPVRIFSYERPGIRAVTPSRQCDVNRGGERISPFVLPGQVGVVLPCQGGAAVGTAQE